MKRQFSEPYSNFEHGTAGFHGRWWPLEVVLRRELAARISLFIASQMDDFDSDSKKIFCTPMKGVFD